MYSRHLWKFFFIISFAFVMKVIMAFFPQSQRLISPHQEEDLYENLSFYEKKYKLRLLFTMVSTAIICFLLYLITDNFYVNYLPCSNKENCYAYTLTATYVALFFLSLGISGAITVSLDSILLGDKNDQFQIYMDHKNNFNTTQVELFSCFTAIMIALPLMISTSNHYFHIGEEKISYSSFLDFHTEELLFADIESIEFYHHYKDSTKSKSKGPIYVINAKDSTLYSTAVPQTASNPKKFDKQALLEKIFGEIAKRADKEIIIKEEDLVYEL